MTLSPAENLKTLLQSYIDQGSSIDNVKQTLTQLSPDLRYVLISSVKGGTNSLRTCLHTAARGGRNDVMTCLLDGMTQEQKVSSTQLQDENSYTALHTAAEQGHTGVMKLMLDGVLPQRRWTLYQVQASDKSTPVHLAVANGHKEMVKYLLADLTALQKFGLFRMQTVDKCTPLHLATKKGHKEIAKELLADLTTPQIFDLVVLQEKEGKSALHFSTELGHTEVVKLLLDGLSLEQKFMLVGLQSIEESTALHAGSTNGRVEIVKHLVKGFTQHQIFEVTTLRDKNRWTPLHLAVKHGHTEVVKGLLEDMTPQQKFQMLKLETTDGNTALHVAVLAKKTEMVLTMLSLLSPTFQQQLLTTTNDKGKSVDADASQALCAAADFAMKVSAELADANKEVANLKNEVDSLKNEILQVTTKSTLTDDQADSSAKEVKKRRVTFKKKLPTTSPSIIDDLKRLMDLNEVPHYQILRDPRDANRIQVTGTEVETLHEELSDVGDKHGVVIEPKDITIYLGPHGMPLLSNWIVTCAGMNGGPKFSLCLDESHVVTVNAIMEGLLKGRRRKTKEYFALTSAHALLSESQKGRLAGNAADWQHVHDEVRLESYSKVYYMAVKDGQEVDVRPPPKCLCKYWVREGEESEEGAYRDIAFLNLLSNQVEADGLVESGDRSAREEEHAFLADIFTKEAAAELVGKKITCKGIAGTLLDSSRISGEDGEGGRHVMGCHLEFIFDDRNEKLLPGDCGSFVYLADRVDGKLPIVGMFFGRLVRDNRVHCAVLLSWNIKLAMEAEVVQLMDIKLAACAPELDGRCSEEVETGEELTGLQVVPNGEDMESIGEETKWMDTGIKLKEKEAVEAVRC